MSTSIPRAAARDGGQGKGMRWRQDIGWDWGPGGRAQVDWVSACVNLYASRLQRVGRGQYKRMGGRVKWTPYSCQTICLLKVKALPLHSLFHAYFMHDSGLHCFASYRQDL